MPGPAPSHTYVSLGTPLKADYSAPADPINPLLGYRSLSVADLLAARNLYHHALTARKGVIGTAIGKYFIRNGDSWPGDRHRVKGQGPKTLDTSGVRPYSWPCVLVFVESWIEEKSFAGHTTDAASPRDLVPDRLIMPDGKVVPVCVLEAPKSQYVVESDVTSVMPGNYIGGGYPLLCKVQGCEHYASVGCLVSDGHKVYALTNRHVVGTEGETIYALLEGEVTPIGKSSGKQIGRLQFDSVYEGWAAKNVFLNMDVGLVEIDDINKWVPQVYGIGTLGPVADLSTENISLDLIGAKISAYGGASREMKGCIWGLFYRYGSMGGFEYVSDLLIGARQDEKCRQLPFSTHHGDSGTLWMLDPIEGATSGEQITYRPIALQWGGQVFTDVNGDKQKSFAMGTLLSTICHKLEVTPVRDWDFEVPEYWGTFGHFTIANLACNIVGATNSNVRQFFQNNLLNITFQPDKLEVSKLGGLSKGPFVPLADVPDLVWKMSSVPGARKNGGNDPEGPNHFADMDEKPTDGSPTLLDLCKNPANIDPDVWIDYATKLPHHPGKKSGPKAMGLLPFRVWQIYDLMVDAVRSGDREGYLVAAGVIAHYVGDSCQPLHISYLHHGDPDNPVTVTKPGKDKPVNLSSGVHEDYEQNMFRSVGGEVKTKLAATLKPRSGRLVQGGRAAANATVKGMQATFAAINPREICKVYDKALTDGSSGILNILWQKFGPRTIDVMADGCRLLALLWESAWVEGNGDQKINDLSLCDWHDLKKMYLKKTTLPSFLLTEIKPHLKGVGTPAKKSPAKKAAKKQASNKVGAKMAAKTTRKKAAKKIAARKVAKKAGKKSAPRR